MTTGSAPRRLVWAVGLAALIAGAGGGVLSGAERGIGEDARQVEPAPPRPAAPESEARRPPSAPSEPVGGVEIAAPESGAKLRGVALVEVDWGNPMGYVIFRIDDKFTYATTPPYEMRWDTSTALDGQHVVAVDAYDSEGEYAGTSSISVVVENAIPTPPDGVLLVVEFGEHDMLARRISARGELSELREGEALPAGFEVLEGQFRGEMSQSVMDALYEGGSALVRCRLREGSIMAEGQPRSVPETGEYSMVQVSRNGLALPTSTSKPRLGFAEISLTLRDFPVLPGDTWQAPIGVVCDLYTRRAIYVQARHTFEGLRWYRGQECAVVTCRYEVSELPLLESGSTQAGLDMPDRAASYRLELTQFRGPRGGPRGMMGGARAGMRGPGARGPTTGTAAGPTRPAAGAGELYSVRLTDLEGTRQTFLAVSSGRVLHAEDTIYGKVEFRAAQQAAHRSESPYRLDLTQFRGPRGGPRGMMGGARGRMGGPSAGMRGEGVAGRPGAARSTPGGGAAQRGAGLIPPRLDYGFHLTTDLVED